jgi:hypothetical protein
MLNELATKMIKKLKQLSDALHFEELENRASTTEERVSKRLVRYVDTFARCGAASGDLVGEDQVWCVD